MLDLSPLWVSVTWSVALAIVLLVHCAHFIRMRGQTRWWHFTHILMLLGMIYMYSAMAFHLRWIRPVDWRWFHAAVAAAILGWMIARSRRRRPFSFLWLLAWAQHVAMIYMWTPVELWPVGLTYALVAYFTLETLAWLGGLCKDLWPDDAKMAVGPGDRSWAVSMHPESSLFDDIGFALMAASMGYMLLAMQWMEMGMT
jgi:hypothetical protein